MESIEGITPGGRAMLFNRIQSKEFTEIASAENHVCHRNVNTRKALEGAACVEPIDQNQLVSAIAHSA
jgi:hypothetical protein